MRVTKSDLFEDIAVSMDSWVVAASEALIKPEPDLVWVEEPELYQRLQRTLATAGVDANDLRKVFAECLRGFAVSILTSVDGGTALAEKGRVYLVDEDGDRLGEGLHDDFVSHLLDTGRLR